MRFLFHTEHFKTERDGEEINGVRGGTASFIGIRMDKTRNAGGGGSQTVDFKQKHDMMLFDL